MEPARFSRARDSALSRSLLWRGKSMELSYIVLTAGTRKDQGSQPRVAAQLLPWLGMGSLRSPDQCQRLAGTLQVS